MRRAVGLSGAGTARRTRVRRALQWTGLAGLLAVATTGCSVDEVLRFGWPVGVTPEADEMRQLWTYSAVAALAVGAIVWGLTAWTVAFHRRKEGASELPRQFQYNLPLELVLTVVPLIIVAVLFYFTVVVQNTVDRTATGNELKVNVTAFQWNWEFAYPDSRQPDGLPVATVGTTNAVPLLVLPTQRPIAFTQRSEDVIHSFWVPQFHFKRDVMPYPEKNDQKNTWVIDRIDQAGSFVGRCAEYCGSYHSMMNFEVRALPPELFDRYMQMRQTVNPATGLGFTAADALAAMNCGELCTPTSVTTSPFNPTRPRGSRSDRAYDPKERIAVKVESRIFEILTVFCFTCAIVYGLLSGEQVGIVALTLTGGLTLIVGTYFRFVARRLDERPEDNPEAEVSDGAGDVGFFSPGSYWPIAVAGGTAVMGFGLALYQWWLIVFGMVSLIIAICGLVFEYHAGPEAH